MNICRLKPEQGKYEKIKLNIGEKTGGKDLWRLTSFLEVGASVHTGMVYTRQHVVCSIWLYNSSLKYIYILVFVHLEILWTIHLCSLDLGSLATYTLDSFSVYYYP